MRHVRQALELLKPDHDGIWLVAVHDHHQFGMRIAQRGGGIGFELPYADGLYDVLL